MSRPTPTAGSMSPPDPCPSGTRCGDRCVQVDSDRAHCGRCDNACSGNRVCQAGLCTKPKDVDERGDRDSDDTRALNVDELESMLAVFGVSLEEFAKAMGVKVSELDETEIGLSDLGRVGITVAALSLLGFTADALALIGIDIDG